MNNQIESNEESPINKVELYEKKTFKELYVEYNKNHSKKGYFIVGWELLNRLYLSLESYGYTIPNLDQKGNHRIRPDKSIQPAFLQFMKNRYIDLSDMFEGGQIIDNDDQIEFRIKHFKNKYLPDFIEFFENEWLVNMAINYFKSRDKNALKFLPCLLTDPIFVPKENEQPKPNEMKKMNEKELADECRRTVRACFIKIDIKK